MVVVFFGTKMEDTLGVFDEEESDCMSGVVVFFATTTEVDDFVDEVVK